MPRRLKQQVRQVAITTTGTWPFPCQAFPLPFPLFCQKSNHPSSKIVVVFAEEIKSGSLQSCGQCNCLKNKKKGRKREPANGLTFPPWLAFDVCLLFAFLLACLFMCSGMAWLLLSSTTVFDRRVEEHVQTFPHVCLFGTCAPCCHLVDCR